MEKTYPAINVGGGASSPTNPELENRVSELENNVVKLNPQELTSEQQAQVKENLGLTTDAVPLATYATGAGGLVQQDATLLLQNYDNYEGHLIEFFANETKPDKLVSVGFVMKTLNNEPVLIEIDRDGSIVKWTKTANSRAGGEIIRSLNYTKTNKTYHVKLLTNQVAMMKELIVGVEFYFNVNGENILHYVKDKIEFPESGESNAVVYLGKVIMPAPNALSEDIALTYNKDTGDLKVSASKESTLIPDTFKITSVKGVLR